jgi:TetR/AcrR family transcriptional regulator, transcriptional repressor for nem operon
MIFMTYGRPREFDVDHALAAATQQFWAEGYEATSLQDLLKAMNLSKSSLYQTFGKKYDLFIRCLEFYQQSMVDELNTQLINSISPKQFLSDFLEGVILEAKTKATRKGCFLVNTANELSQRDAGVAKAVSCGTRNLSEVFHRAIEQGKNQKLINNNMSTESLVDYLMTSISGLRTMIKAGADRDTLNPVINIIMQTLYTNESAYK